MVTTLASVQEDSGRHTYLLRILPKSWQNYINASIAISFGIYGIAAFWSYLDGSLTSYISILEWIIDPFYLLTCMIVLKLVSDIFHSKLNNLRETFDGQLESDSGIIFNSGAAFLLAIPFIVYATVVGLQGVNLVSPDLLIVISWNLDYLFFAGFAWFMIGFLFFMSKMSRYKVKGNPVEIVIGDKMAGLRKISTSLAVPIILFEFIDTYYFLAVGFFPTDVVAFFLILALIVLLFAIPPVVVNSLIGSQKEKIVSELTGNYVSYVERVLKGEEEYDAAKAQRHQEIRSLLEKRLGHRKDVTAGMLPIILPLVNLALAYIVQTWLTRII